MRATLAIARNCAKCGLRSKGIWLVVLLTVLPMVLLYLLLALVPQEMIAVAAQFAAAVHGDSLEETKEIFTQMDREQYGKLLLDMAVSGSLKTIGAVATLLAVFFTTFTNEAARKSVSSVLAHPVRRTSIVVGSFLGTLVVVIPATFAMSAIAFLLFLARSGQANWGFLMGAAYICSSLVPVTAYAVLFSTVLHPAVGSLTALTYVWAASKTYTVSLVLDQIEGFFKTVGGLWFYAVPRLGDFGTMAIDYASRINVGGDQAAPIAGPMTVAFALAAAHTVLALVVAGVRLGKREF